MGNAEADFIIIGAGIAGLYTAYKLRKEAPAATILVLEASTHPGGRAAMARFGKMDVVLGAGIGRAQKDVLLTSLLNELKVSFRTFPRTHDYGPNIINAPHVGKDIAALQKAYTKATSGTFEAFVKGQFGAVKAAAFFESLSYTDMLKEDVGEVLQHYGLDDNYDPLRGQKAQGMYVPWTDLVNALIAKVGKRSVMCNVTVTKILSTSGGVKIAVKTGDNDATFTAKKKLIIAATQPTLRALMPKEKAYKQIGVNTFLRVYAKVSPSSCKMMAVAVPGYMVVEAPLQKIIPMNPDAGIYMIAYSDNVSADTLRPHLRNTAPNRRFWARHVEEAVGLPKGALDIESIMGKYWEVGTHYMKPGFASSYASTKAFFDHAQHPLPNVMVVGEVVSAHNRGWVEGALESVEAGLTQM